MDSRARIAVLGGLGFIGSHLVRRLVEAGADVTIFDKPDAPRGHLDDLAARIRIFEGTIQQTESVIDAIRDSSAVFNLVHTTVPGASMRDPGYDIASNILPTVRWLERLGETGIRTVVYNSSGGTVYGPARFLPITEDHPTDPTSSYGITKLAIEKYTALYAARNAVNWRIARAANAYGPGQRATTGQGIVAVALERLERGQPIEVWGDGSVARDYVHVEDIAAALAAIGAYTGPERIFNIGSGTAKSVNEILDLIAQSSGRIVRRKYLPAREHDVPSNALDASLLTRETGWRPRISLEEGLRALSGV